MGKIHKAGMGSLGPAASNQSTGPRAGSWVRPRRAQPGSLVGHFRSQRVRWCSVLHSVHMLPMLRIQTRPLARAGDRKGRPRGARLVSRGPNAGGQRGCANLGKLELCQGLLIPWYLEDKDCDYLHVPRLVAAPAANAASPSSGLGSFEM
jgi:hypothetical protein